MLPRITMEGRLAAEPELRFAPSGVAVCRLRLVTSDRRKNPNTNEWEDGDTLWINATCFKQLAENTAESIEKGDLVVVTGKIKTDSWETNEGEKRSAITLIADTVAADLKFRTIKHGEGRAQRSQASSQQRSEDPFASDQPDEPPF
jgi:single-strand DNA-binding protein